eukprot:TRINITY_DN65953_c0_g1_i1.p2 TRINITY_DN65953_c0_g1~~TRINITY_DN65953_c0_g1_i1.p2  ORF type:complete len:218 (-),score=38.77 TRINITY_DN65953_c0_g1_i1:331-984(-)
MQSAFSAYNSAAASASAEDGRDKKRQRPPKSDNATAAAVPVPADGDKQQLRLLLHTAATARRAFDSSAFIFLLDCETAKKQLYDIKEKWFQDRPKDAAKTKAAHPSGMSLEVVCIACILSYMLHNSKTEQAKKDVQQLLDTDPKIMHTYLAGVYPKYSKPRDGRKWVWNITVRVTAPEGFRLLLTQLLQHEINKAQWLQSLSLASNLEKELWKQLQK